NVLLQERSLFLREFRHTLGCNRVVLQTFVHERNVVLQDRATVRLPIVAQNRGSESVQRRLHADAIRRHRWTPALVIGAVDIGRNDLAERHGAVTNRLHKLIVNRHSWSIEWRLAGPVEDEASAFARE